MANKKISELTAIDAVSAGDLFAVVDDPSGTPVTKKSTLTQLLATAEKTANKDVASGYLGLDASSAILIDLQLQPTKVIRWGTTNLFPALKRSTTLLEVKLADDSAYTSIKALKHLLSASSGGLSGDATFTDILAPDGGAYLRLSNGTIHINSATLEFSEGGVPRIRISTPSDGVLNIKDNAGTSFGRFQLGGATDLFPALKRSGAEIQIRVADDTAYARIDALGYKASGVAGVSFGPAAVTSVTVVNGIITAIS